MLEKTTGHLNKQESLLIQEKLDNIQDTFQVEMQKVFGMTLPNKNRDEFKPNAELSSDLIFGLIKKGQETLARQRKLLFDADRVTEATDADMNSGQDEVILTDFERALEFLDEASPKKNDTSLRKVWGEIVRDAKNNPEKLSPMSDKRPSILFPRGLQAPVFGRFDRSIWEKQRQALIKATQERIKEVDFFVKENLLEKNTSRENN